MSQCIRCGYCCSVRPCSYGTYVNNSCIYLEIDDKKIGTYKCKIYKEIIEKEKNNKYPMFGCGCSSSLFNEIREKVKNNLLFSREKDKNREI